MSTTEFIYGQERQYLQLWEGFCGAGESLDLYTVPDGNILVITGAFLTMDGYAELAVTANCRLIETVSNITIWGQFTSASSPASFGIPIDITLSAGRHLQLQASSDADWSTQGGGYLVASPYGLTE